MKHVFIKVTFPTLMIIGLLIACSSSRVSTKAPHFYTNSFNETIQAVDRALKNERMEVKDSKKVDENTYFVRFYQPSKMINERNAETGLNGEITIKRIEANRTSITIKEDKQSDLIPREYRQNLAYDVFRQLEKLLTLEPSSK